MTDQSSLDAVFDALDKQAVCLLDSLQTNGESSVENKTDRPSITERVKIFEAVVAYATMRSKAQPRKAAPKESTFGRTKALFHGDGAETGRGRGRAKASSTSTNGSVGTA